MPRRIEPGLGAGPRIRHRPGHSRVERNQERPERRLHVRLVEVPEHPGRHDGRARGADDDGQDLAREGVAQQRQPSADESRGTTYTLAQSLAISQAQLRSRQEPECGRQPENADGDKDEPDDGHDPVECVPEPVVAKEFPSYPDVAQPGQDIRPGRRSRPPPP